MPRRAVAPAFSAWRIFRRSDSPVLSREELLRREIDAKRGARAPRRSRARRENPSRARSASTSCASPSAKYGITCTRPGQRRRRRAEHLGQDRDVAHDGPALEDRSGHDEGAHRAWPQHERRADHFAVAPSEKVPNGKSASRHRDGRPRTRLRVRARARVVDERVEVRRVARRKGLSVRDFERLHRLNVAPTVTLM